MPVFSTNRVFLGLLTTQYEGTDPAMAIFARNVRENFQRLQNFLWPPGGPPMGGPTNVTVVTGINGTNLTTAVVGVMGFSNGANVAIGEQRTVITGASIGSDTIDFTREGLIVLSHTNLSTTQLSGTSCT